MHVLSGGAAAAVVKAVQAEFEKSTGTSIHSTFSAVGQMRDLLVGGAACDVIILKLSGAGRVEEDSKRRCNVAGIQAVILVSPESPKEKKSKKDTAEEYTEAVLITSQRRADGYLCLNKSERLHLLLFAREN
jgi:ABC-type molybdate transport system substrate-binding protein